MTNASESVIEWTSGNFKEILPDNLSTYSESMLPDLFNGAFKKLYGLYGCELKADQRRIVDVFEKKAYFNITALYTLAEEFWGVDGCKVIEAMGGRISSRIKQKAFVRPSVPERLCRYLRVMIVTLTAIYKVRCFKPANMPNDESLASLERAEKLLSEQLAYHLAIGLFTTSLIDSLVKAMKKSQNDLSAQEIHAVLRGTGAAPSIRQQQAWNELIDAYLAKVGADDEAARLFEDKFAEYLAKFGDRCVFEMEVATPRLKENPQRILDELSMLAETKQRSANDDQRIAAKETGMQKHGRFIKRYGLMSPLLHILAACARQMITEREISKAGIAAAARVRSKLLDLSRSMSLDGIGCEQDIFFMKSQEIKYIHSHALGTARVLVYARKRQTAEVPADNLLQRNGAFVKPEQQPMDSGVLSGLAVSSGIVKGYVRILENTNDVSELKKGEIAVVRALDAGWSLLFSVAGGIITEIGGMVSHAAILVREENIPAIFNVGNLFQNLRNGDFVKLNCSTGIITKIAPEQTLKSFAITLPPHYPHLYKD